MEMFYTIFKELISYSFFFSFEKNNMIHYNFENHIESLLFLNLNIMWLKYKLNYTFLFKFVKIPIF